MRRLVFVFAAIGVISVAIQVATPERIAEAASGRLTLLLRELR